MLRILFLLVSLMDLPLAWASCEFDEKAVELPAILHESAPCYKMEGELSLSKANEKGFIKLDTPAIEFSRVPSPSILHYLKVDQNEYSRAVKVTAMTYLCSGEVPVASEAASLIIDDQASTEENHEVFIESGTDLTALGNKRKKKTRVYEDFIKVYEEKTQESSGAVERVYVPNLILNQGLYSEKMQELFSFFFRQTNSPLNACEGAFRKSMQRYILKSTQGPGPHGKLTFKILVKQK